MERRFKGRPPRRGKKDGENLRKEGRSEATKGRGGGLRRQRMRGYGSRNAQQQKQQSFARGDDHTDPHTGDK